jgi:hypothetical protein
MVQVTGITKCAGIRIRTGAGSMVEKRVGFASLKRRIERDTVLAA